MKSSMPYELLQQETPQQQMENHPVIRTLYDHTAVGGGGGGGGDVLVAFCGCGGWWWCFGGFLWLLLVGGDGSGCGCYGC